MNKNFGIYIHWPFCAAKCPYCDFNSHVAKKQVNEIEFANALITELNFYKNLIGEKKVESIFFGGGTPSLMGEKSVALLLEAINKNFKVTNNVEITLEANPSSVEAGRFQGYKQAGVNRISIGVQSLIDSQLKFLGRLHTAKEALVAIELANKFFKRFSFDLIYARPKQTTKQWQDELQQALQLGATHLSLYQLTIEPNTAFFNLHQSGKLKIPNDELAAELYLLTNELTAKYKLANYEISNYAIKGEESKHNLIYWQSGEWLGVGPGAHSRLEIKSAHSRLEIKNKRHAISNILLPQQWQAQVKQTGQGKANEQILTPKQIAEEFLLMGLRLAEGIDLTNFNSINGFKLSGDKINHFIELKLLTKKNNRLAATANGKLLLNKIISELATIENS